MKKIKHILSIKLAVNGDKCFGPGMAQLLELVKEHKSLRAAAASMNMAYSKAWRILNESEKALGFPLLVRTVGGKHGGGAQLTEKALMLLDAYNSYTKAVNAKAEDMVDEYFKMIL